MTWFSINGAFLSPLQRRRWAAFFPIRDFFPAVRMDTAIGGALIGNLRKRNLNRVLKASIASIDIIDSDQ